MIFLLALLLVGSVAVAGAAALLVFVGFVLWRLARTPRRRPLLLPAEAVADKLFVFRSELDNQPGADKASRN